ncbi:hypothetical protein [Nitrosospira sp. NRS527]|nr:hypothetical protein [Nitrosospira sp. NRS527]BCT67642.1 hypothetical protein NNRS527_01229 [Nitrosospira sp. NRS527]
MMETVEIPEQHQRKQPGLRLLPAGIVVSGVPWPLPLPRKVPISPLPI